MPERKTSLHWFPTDPSQELTDPVVLRMKPEQYGAWCLLRLVAWGDGSKEPSLPADDESLAFLSRLGERWRTMGALLRSQFVEREGRLYHAGWTELWQLQQAKYTAASGKGGKGGAQKAENRRSKLGSSSATAQLPANRRAGPLKGPSSIGDVVSSATAQLQPSSSSALAIEGSVQQNLGPGGLPEPAAAGPAPQLELAIGAKVEEYRQAHPDEAARLESDVRADLRVSRSRMLSREEELRVQARMLEILGAGGEGLDEGTG